MSYINYDEEPEDEPTKNWTHGAFKTHWYNLYVGVWNAKPRWGIKETTLLRKLINEYDSEALSEMMEIAIGEAAQPLPFAVFYTNASKWHQIWKERNAGWEWN